MIIISSTLGLGYRLTSGLRSVLPQIQSLAEFYTEICCYHYKILYLILVVRPIYPILICLSISWHSNFIGYTVQHLGVFSCYTSHSICDAYIAVAVHFGYAQELDDVYRQATIHPEEKEVFPKKHFTQYIIEKFILYITIETATPFFSQSILYQ